MDFILVFAFADFALGERFSEVNDIILFRSSQLIDASTSNDCRFGCEFRSLLFIGNSNAIAIDDLLSGKISIGRLLSNANAER